MEEVLLTPKNCVEGIQVRFSSKFTREAALPHGVDQDSIGVFVKDFYKSEVCTIFFQNINQHCNYYYYELQIANPIENFSITTLLYSLDKLEKKFIKNKKYGKV